MSHAGLLRAAPALLVAVIVGPGLLILGVWSLSRGVPDSYYRAVVPLDEAESRARAEALERGAATALSQPRESQEPWTVEIKQEDAAAWLIHRLPAWLENQNARLPEEWSEPRVSFEGGRVFIGVLDARGRVLGVSGVPTIVDHSLKFGEARVTLGRLALPARVVAGAVADPTLRDLLAGTDGLAARFALDDGRRVIIRRLDARGGRLRMTCVTIEAGS